MIQKPQALPQPISADPRQLLLRLLSQLKQFLGTENDVVLLTCSGTGAMEASVSNLTSPGDRILVLAAGKYGERWTAIGKNLGCHVDTVRKPWGETFTLDEIRAALKLETRAVFVQAHEPATGSSTGTRHDIAAIGELLRDEESEALLVVDAIGALSAIGALDAVEAAGATHLDMNASGIDVLIGSSDEALDFPAGLSFLTLSERAWDRMEATYNPRYYFDLRKARKHHLDGETPFTPPLALIAALSGALDRIAAEAEGNLGEGRRGMIHNAETLPPSE